VLEAMIRDLRFSNELPVEHMWRILEPRIESVRRDLAREFGCDPEEMGITRNASESNEIMIMGLDLKRGDEVVVSNQNYGRMLLDFMLIGNLTPNELLKRMSVDGLENLDTALSKGRGAIMAVPHMGSWDMAGAYAGALGYPISAVTERFPGSLNDAVVRTRSRFGLKVIMLGRSAVRSITEALEANSIVALLCDLEQGPGVDVRFFGRRAVVPGGPAAIALKTGAALLPAYPHMVSPGLHHVHLDPAMSWPSGTTKEGLMQKVISRFEEFIRARPDQWYAFRTMFKNEG
jgi:KDO2-lipid IV(A) lauroyltransferase